MFVDKLKLTAGSAAASLTTLPITMGRVDTAVLMPGNCARRFVPWMEAGMAAAPDRKQLRVVPRTSS